MWNSIKRFFGWTSPATALKDPVIPTPPTGKPDSRQVRRQKQRRNRLSSTSITHHHNDDTDLLDVAVAAVILDEVLSPEPVYEESYTPSYDSSSSYSDSGSDFGGSDD